MKFKEVKRTEAETRQAEYDLLTPAEKIAKLDKAFGKGEGAAKERAKLANKLTASASTETPKKKARA